MEILSGAKGHFHVVKWPDINIFRNGLIKELKDGEKVEADMGYRREQHFVKLPSGHEDDAQRVRSCQETVNTWFKQWG
jgi:hypothetical protein